MAALQLHRRRGAAAKSPVRWPLALPRPKAGRSGAGGSAGVYFLVVEEELDLPIAVPLSGARGNHVIARRRRRERAAPADRILLSVDRRHHGGLFHEGIEIHTPLSPDRKSTRL